ncbi:hypothetical protein J437_LFUL007675 [Ladona fulva]|uniref:Uncharacterized protein n=1 Tax=Ladona fulva TaxID=123851 RepID=A0A8K0KC97_LADFU|nr:hypothetical protein J437_LFUL007675 [Ladona fulva]
MNVSHKISFNLLRVTQCHVIEAHVTCVVPPATFGIRAPAAQKYIREYNRVKSEESSSGEEDLQQSREDLSSDDERGNAEVTADIILVDELPLFQDIPFVGKPGLVRFNVNVYLCDHCINPTGLRTDVGNKSFDYFNLIFTSDFYKLIIKETNGNEEPVFLEGVSNLINQRSQNGKS